MASSFSIKSETLSVLTCRKTDKNGCGHHIARLIDTIKEGNGGKSCN